MIGSGVGFLYNGLDFGVPFGQQLAAFWGCRATSPSSRSTSTSSRARLLAGIIGLGLSEAAYMAEIARAGILSVDHGQAEAAQALGMNRGKAMRRIVLPQAMRVIVPPTGNETIAMVKDTSLLSAIPVITELFYQTQAIGNRTLLIMPAFVAVTAWYLIICSVLMVGQSFLEKRFGRGFGTACTRQALRAPAGGGRRLMSDTTTELRARRALTTATASRWCTPSTSSRASTAPRCSRASTSTCTGARWCACSGRRARARRRSCAASTSSRPSTAAASGSTAS